MKYRIYYNGPEPPMWSIDEGSKSTEVCVQHVEVGVLNVRFCTDPSNESVRAWAEVNGRLTIIEGIALFKDWD